MCFDATTSVTAFGIAFVSALCLYHQGIVKKDNNNLFFSGLLILVALVQLLEYLIWNNQNCDRSNHALSMMLFGIISLQPVAIANLYYYFLSNSSGFLYSIVLLYSVMFSGFSGFVMHWLDQMPLCTTPTNTSCRLHWASFTQLATHEWYFGVWSTMYIAPWLLCTALMCTLHYKDIAKYPVRHIFVPASLLLTISYILYQRNSMSAFLDKPGIFSQHADAWGSLWCFSGVMLGIVALLEV